MSKTVTTQLLRYELVKEIKDHVFPTLSNTYVGIGRPVYWGDDETETPSEIEEVSHTTNYYNQLFRDLVALKKVEPADTALVVPRVDWLTGTVYKPYEDHFEMFTYDSYTDLGTVDANGKTVIQNTAVLTGNISTGNIVTIGLETREVVEFADNIITLNANLSIIHTGNVMVRGDNTYPQFANTFYVRNSKDQVFKCLYSGDIASNTEPTIDIDGQLPENPYILTADGYKWKYLYTIPYGLKQKFFTRTWMPVISNDSVVAGAVNGRIDVVSIIDGGSGYFLDNGESGNSNSLSIITVSGDGTGASITARVESGVITGLNILNGGSGYTDATLTISDSDQLANGNIANLDVVISPPGGHGSNPTKELGCYSVMTSLDFVGTESDKIRVTSFDFRQISILRDPLLTTGLYANGSVYRVTTKLQMTDPGSSEYQPDETVYIGGSIETSTFSATVVSWNPSTNELYVNNISGEIVVGSTLTGSVGAAGGTILASEEPSVESFTGDILFIENRAKIVRDTDQTEQIRIVLSF